MPRPGSAVVAALSRVALGVLFIDGGVDVLRNTAPRAKAAAQTLAALRTAAPAFAAPALAASDVTLVRVNAAAQVLGGLALVTGRRRRLAALGLATSLIPTTLAGHPYWTITDAAQRREQRTQFEKNLAVLGGLALVATARRR